MATRYGHQTLEWLVQRGWQAAPVEDTNSFGDRWVIDPKTHQEMNVYQAVSLHKERTGELPEFLAEYFS